MQNASYPRARVLHGTVCAWRQWAFAKGGWAFMVVSLIHDDEAKLLPEVQQRLAWIKAAPAATT